MRAPKYQFFTLEEYQGRLDALRRRMEERGIDVLLVNSPENLYYLSGYQTPGYYWYQTLIVTMDREPVFITRLNEESNIEPQSWVEDSRPYEDHEDWIAHTRDVLMDLGKADVRIGVQYDSFFLTSRDEKGLTAALSSATFVDGSGLVEEGRMVKSAQEIEYIRQAAKTAEAGLRAGIEACQVGVTENDVAAEIHRAQIKAGSEYTGLPIFIRTGERDSMTHSTWYRNVLQPGDSVTIEMPGCINRYHAATYRQIFLGDPPELLLRAREVGERGYGEGEVGDQAGGPGGGYTPAGAGQPGGGDGPSEQEEQSGGVFHRNSFCAGLGRGAYHQHDGGGGPATSGGNDLPLAGGARGPAGIGQSEEGGEQRHDSRHRGRVRDADGRVGA